jgi:uncharacterized protein (TIGR03435 family)
MDMKAGVLYINGDHLTMDGFADMLSRMLQIGGPGQQVVNMTGLAGSYEVSMEYNLADLMAAARAQGVGGPDAGGGAAATTAPQASDPGGGAGTTVYGSVEKAGLKLEKRKATVEQLVIDSVEKSPTEN